MAAFNAEQLNIVLNAQTKDLRQELQKAERRIKGFEAKSKKSLNNTSVAFASLSRAAKAATAAIAAAVTVQAIRNSAEYGREIANLANVAGAGTTEFQRMAVAAKTVGISQEKLADILKDVSDRVGDFLQTGGGPMKDFFENVAPLVGVTADQFKNLSGPDALQLYVSTLQKAGASQQDFTFYMEAMASDATALVPLLRDNGVAMRDMGDEAERTGRVLSGETIDGAVRLGNTLDSLEGQIRDRFITALIGTEDELQIIAGFITDDVIPAIEAMVGVLASAVDKWNDLKTLMRFARTGEIPAGTEQNLIGGGAYTGDASSLSYADAVRIYGQEDADVMFPNGPPKAANPLSINIEPNGLGIAPANTAETAKAAERAAVELEALRSEYEQLLSSIDPVVAAQMEFAATQRTVNDAIDKGIITQEEGFAALDKYSQSLANASLEASNLAGAMDSIQSSMESAFMGMVDGTVTAQDAFRSMARDIIKELYRVLVVQRLVGSFSADGGGILGGVFNAVGGKASGGPVTAGSPYMVGEHGRELFVPQSAGRVLSVAQTKDVLSGGSSGITIVQNNTFGDGVSRGEINAMLPKIVETTKAAVFDAQRRSVTGRGY